MNSATRRAVIESLESRRLCSRTLQETAGETFTAVLGLTAPLSYTTPQATTQIKSAVTAVTFSVHATIHWGDGKTSAGKVVKESDGTFKIEGSHQYAAAGQYTIVVYNSRSASGNGPIPEFIQAFTTIHDVAEISAAT